MTVFFALRRTIVHTLVVLGEKWLGLLQDSSSLGNLKVSRRAEPQNFSRWSDDAILGRSSAYRFMLVLRLLQGCRIN